MKAEYKERTEAEHVLVVEDDPVWMRIHKSILEERCIKVTAVSDVKEALELLEQGGFNRVITDGLEGTWLVIAAKTKQLGIPMKLISGDVRHESQAKEIGVEFIDKSKVPKLIDQL